ncbi:MAG: ABC transporter transmembrane domain-containing protein [Pseudomonadota bacterium]|nr:ABC transporter transmembrane domain-containing protein [Pseudomonadota bacterium]
MAASLGINVLALGLPLALLQVFDRVLPNRAEATLAVLFGALLVFAGLEFALRLARLGLLGDAGERYELRLTDAVATRFLHADPAAFEATTGGAHLDRINAIAQLRDHYGGQGRLLALDLPFAAVFVGMIGLIGGPLALAPLGSLCALGLASVVLRRLQAPALAERESVDRRRYSFLMETLGQIETLKVHAMEPRMMRRYELLQMQAEQASRRLIRASGLTQAVSAVMSQAGVAAMAAAGGLLAVEGRLGMAEIAACMLLNGRAMQPMSRAMGLWVQHAQLRGAETRLAEVEALAGDAAPDGPAAAEPLRGAVSFVGVGFGRPGRPDARELSVRIEPGRCLAFTGAAGDEGSVLLRMVLGELAPERGEVRIDGRATSRFGHPRGRGGMVLVDGRPAVFEGSLLDNLSMFGDAEARDAAIDAARRIGLDEQIDRMARGFDTPALIRGRQTGTVGFLQRVGIARALACDPRILLFDEANTALDMVADRKLLSALADLRGRTTLILSTRRPSYLTLADQVVDLSRTDARGTISATPAAALRARAAPAPLRPEDPARETAQAGKPAASGRPAEQRRAGPDDPGAAPPTGAPTAPEPRRSRRGAGGSMSVSGSGWLAGAPSRPRGNGGSDAAPGRAGPPIRPVNPAAASAPGAAGPAAAAASPTGRPLSPAVPLNLFAEPSPDAAAAAQADMDAWARDLAAELGAAIVPARGGRVRREMAE